MATTATKRKASAEAPKPASAAQPWSHGKFHWNELRTRDAERAKRFYRDTIGWSFERSSTPDGRDYWVRMDGRPVRRGPVPADRARCEVRAGELDVLPRRRRRRCARRQGR